MVAQPVGLTKIEIQGENGEWVPLLTIEPSYTVGFRVYSKLRDRFISSQKSKGSPEIGKIFTERGLKSWVRLVLKSRWGDQDYFVLKYYIWNHGPIQLVQTMTMTEFMGERSK